MDGKSFDALVKSFASGRSRRSVLKGIAGAVSGAAVITLPEETLAAQVCRAASQICGKDGNCCGNLCGPKDRTGRRRCCPTVTVNLDATYAPAVNTGFYLLPGDRLSISATGTTQWCNGCNIVGPDGEVPCGGLGIPFPCGSYVGVIGGGDIYTDYTPFFQLGTGPIEITAVSEGYLYLQYVDGCSTCVNDNTGGFTVTVTSCTGRRVT